MTENEWEKEAAEMRRRLLRIWSGDAKGSDEYMCFLMRYVKDAWAKTPPSERNPKAEARMLKLMAMLIQR